MKTRLLGFSLCCTHSLKTVVFLYCIYGSEHTNTISLYRMASPNTNEHKDAITRNGWPYDYRLTQQKQKKTYKIKYTSMQWKTN